MQFKFLTLCDSIVLKGFHKIYSREISDFSNFDTYFQNFNIIEIVTRKDTFVLVYIYLLLYFKS